MRNLIDLWPPRISRSIAKETLVMCGLSLLVLTVLLMFIGVAREAVRQGVGVAATLEMIPYALPNALAISLPGTVLFSVCCVFGRMSAANEIVALQSVGIPPGRLLRPSLAIAVLLSFVTVWLVNVAFTWGNEGVERVVLSSVERIAYSKLRQSGSFQQGPLTLSVSDVDGDRLIRPSMTVRRGDEPPITINASEAKLTYSTELRGLTVSMTNGTAVMGDRASFRFPDTVVHTVSLHSRPNYDLLATNPSHMPMSDLSPAAVKQSADIHQRERLIAVHTGFDLLTWRADVAAEQGVQRIAELQQSRRRLHRLGAEQHRRWASGFTCLCLAVVGIPLAIRMKTSDVMTTFGVCFLPTLLIYYPIFALTLDMAKDGRMPGFAVWTANILFLMSGVLMLRRTLFT